MPRSTRASSTAKRPSFKRVGGQHPYFEGCMPIEVMASRGLDTLRFGPMKPVGLDNPHWASPEHPTGRWPHAVVQLRQDNKLGTLWNMVGFQTKLKHAEQVRLFRTIPGLENAEFARLGGLHRNTFLDSRVLLDRQLRLKFCAAYPFRRTDHRLRGLCRERLGRAAGGPDDGSGDCRFRLGPPRPAPPRLGALLSHITGDAEAESYQPMNVNFGLFPPPTPRDIRKKQRKEAYTSRAKTDLARMAC